MGNQSAAIALPTQVVDVSVPERSVRRELRAIKVVWQRDLIRFIRDRLRMVTSLLQPVLFLFVLGTGLSALTSGSADGVNLRTFLFPGVLAMAVMFMSFFSAGSIVWDREFGFLREMLVAPVRRSSIVIGKCLGGATVAGFQGIVILCLAGLVGVPYSPVLLLTLVAEMLLLAFALTALGVMAAARIRSMQAFMAMSQMLLMPMFFLSGALFPLVGLPLWMTVLTRIDPASYGIDPIRRTLLGAPAERLALTIADQTVPILAEVGVMVLFGIVFLAIGARSFQHRD